MKNTEITNIERQITALMSEIEFEYRDRQMDEIELSAFNDLIKARAILRETIAANKIAAEYAAECGDHRDIG